MSTPANEPTLDEMGEFIRAEELHYKLEELIEEHGLGQVLMAIGYLQTEN